jgi:hypothetical protein
MEKLVEDHKQVPRKQMSLDLPKFSSRRILAFILRNNNKIPRSEMTRCRAFTLSLYIVLVCRQASLIIA